MCYDEGMLQAYVDNEVSSEQRLEISQHLKKCAKCRNVWEELQSNSHFVNFHLNQYLVNLPVNCTITTTGRQTNLLNRFKRSINTMKSFKKFIATAAMVGVLFITFSFPTVRSMAGEFLTVFRMEKVQTITVNPEDIEQLERVVNEGTGNLEIENFGQVEVTGKHETVSVTLAQASEAVGFAVKLPEPAGYSEPELRMITGSTASLSLDVAKVNTLLQSLGSIELLPESLDGQTFTMQMPTAIMANYHSGNNQLTVTQARSPEMKAPSDVDVLAIRDALLNVPVLPDNLRNQLLAIDDWQHTVLIPNMNGASRDVDVNGSKGVFMNGSNMSENSASMNFLVWQDNGVVYTISGTNLDEKSALAIAGQIR